MTLLGYITTSPLPTQSQITQTIQDSINSRFLS
jgi:hypothetical protein